MSRLDIPKAEWGPGPWQDEPDDAFWVDPKTALPCLLHRHGGTWCGYVGVPPSHPASGMGYDPWREHSFASLERGDHAVREAVSEIAVHGGLTFAGGRDHLLDDRSPYRRWHFFGFDCNHGIDLDPQMEAYQRRENPGPKWLRHEEYRSIAYAKDQCTALASQLGRW